MQAALYHHLAAVLAPSGQSGLPAWFTSPGAQWPLFDHASKIAVISPSPAWHNAITLLASVPASSLANRQEQYDALFIGKGAPPIWLYESYHLYGKLPGPSTFSVRSLYQQVGLQITSAELADHASLEISFLAFLLEIQSTDPAQATDWNTAYRLFIKNHAGRWLPAVGRSLAACPYAAWSAIGLLLIAALEDPPKNTLRHSEHLNLPEITGPQACNLCGFCIQACPTRALYILEDDHTTALHLDPQLCIHCSKCVKICHLESLTLTAAPSPHHNIQLHTSPRASCSLCGAPTVSEAELASVAAKLGNPDWLSYCLDCRKFGPSL